MTESLKNMLRGAKTLDEAYDVLCLHGDELSAEDQRKMFEMVTGRSELTDDELDMVVGGSWFSNAWKSVKNWVSEHKTALIIAGCALAGAVLVGGVCAALGTAGYLLASASVAGQTLVGAMTGGVIGLMVGGCIVGISMKEDQAQQTLEQ